ncbi:unnamed protein product [Callosobruchus maculatus]|nr:unnamed protein product [Callosobruchus maculatus]
MYKEIMKDIYAEETRPGTACQTEETRRLDGAFWRGWKSGTCPAQSIQIRSEDGDTGRAERRLQPYVSFGCSYNSPRHSCLWIGL